MRNLLRWGVETRGSASRMRGMVGGLFLASSKKRNRSISLIFKQKLPLRLSKTMIWISGAISRYSFAAPKRLTLSIRMARVCFCRFLDIMRRASLALLNLYNDLLFATYALSPRAKSNVNEGNSKLCRKLVGNGLPTGCVNWIRLRPN